MTGNQKSINILVAEDNAVTREMMSSILKTKGYNVFGAQDGGEAIEILGNNPIDLAFVDLNMHPKGGFEFIKHLLIKGIHMPVAIVTGDTSGDVLIEANALGVQRILQKPVVPERLLETTERLLRRAGHNLNILGSEQHTTALSAENLMNHAIELAKKNAESKKGGPFGAVVSDEKGHILGEGVNGITARVDPVAHAEVMAIRQAAEKLGRANLSDCVLYCSGEPTMMGKALITSVGIQKVYYGLSHTEISSVLKRDKKTPETTYEQLGREDALSMLKSWEALDEKVSD